MDDFISALEETAIAVAAVSGKAKNSKLQMQLIAVSLHLRNYAIALRKGSVTFPDAALPICMKELGDAGKAAASAKNESDYAMVLVEANEAAIVIGQYVESAGPQAGGLDSAFAATKSLAGLTPLPPDQWPPKWPRWPRPPRNWPFPWPPRPFPPSPWPWPPQPVPPPWWESIDWDRDFFR
ncbi:hypothetical protein [Lysobacter brunescens]|uniref:Uncharacterized protein n=1 Tax=Lysobacter brunescens TaxID=262323 RepID=A0ABW2YAN9_9GAMM